MDLNHNLVLTIWLISLLTTSLLSELKAGKPSRVVVVSSLANKRGGINWDDINWEKNYDKGLAYAQSKTANILFAKQLNKIYASEGIQAYSLQPGGILTNLKQHIPEKQQRAMGWYKDDGTLIDIFKLLKKVRRLVFMLLWHLILISMVASILKIVLLVKV